MSGQGQLTAPAGRGDAVAPPSARPGSDPGAVGRTLRVPVFVAVSSMIGVLAHSAVERTAPHPGLVAVAVFAVTLVALPLRRRRHSFELLTGALLLSQTVVHAVLCLCHAAHDSVLGAFVHSTLCPGDDTGFAGDPWLLSAAGHAGAADGLGYVAHLYPGHGMLLAHLLAAGVAGWWLARGEAAVWAAAGWVWPAVATPPAPAPVPTRAPRRRLHSAVRVLRDQVLDSTTNPRRGPPVRALAPNRAALTPA